MGQRGMPYAALGAGQIAAAHCSSAGRAAGECGAHAALSSGLAALEEARFVSASGEPVVVDVAEKVAMHRTPVLKAHLHGCPVTGRGAAAILCIGQSQLGIAAGGQPVSSQTLYRLGKLETALAGTTPIRNRCTRRRRWFFIRRRLCRPGELSGGQRAGSVACPLWTTAEARQVLLHSVSVRPQLESWHNLAAVHRRLGEEDLSRRAEHERDLIARQTGRQLADQATFCDGSIHRRLPKAE